MVLSRTKVTSVDSASLSACSANTPALSPPKAPHNIVRKVSGWQGTFLRGHALGKSESSRRRIDLQGSLPSLPVSELFLVGTYPGLKRQGKNFSPLNP